MNDLTWSKIKESVNEKDMTILENASYIKAYNEKSVLLNEKHKNAKIEIEEYQQKNKILQDSRYLLQNLTTSNMQNIQLENQLYEGQKERLKHEEKVLEDLRQFSRNTLDELNVNFKTLEKQYHESVPEYEEYENVLKETGLYQFEYELRKQNNKEVREQNKLHGNLMQKQFSNIVIDFVKKIKYYHENMETVKQIEEFTKKGNILLRVYEEKLDKEKMLMSSHGRNNIQELMKYIKENSTPVKPMVNLNTLIRSTPSSSSSVISLSNKKNCTIPASEQIRLLQRAKEREEILKTIYPKTTLPTSIIVKNSNQIDHRKNINKAQVIPQNFLKKNCEQQRSNPINQVQSKIPLKQKSGFLNQSNYMTNRKSLNSETFSPETHVPNNRMMPAQNSVTFNKNSQELKENKENTELNSSQENNQMDYGGMINKRLQELQQSQEKRQLATEEIQSQFKMPKVQEKKTIPKTPKKILSHPEQTPMKVPKSNDNKIDILNQITINPTDFGIKRKLSDISEEVTNKVVRFQDSDDNINNSFSENYVTEFPYFDGISDQSQELTDFNYSTQFFQMNDNQTIEPANCIDGFDLPGEQPTMFQKNDIFTFP